MRARDEMRCRQYPWKLDGSVVSLWFWWKWKNLFTRVRARDSEAANTRIKNEAQKWFSPYGKVERKPSSQSLIIKSIKRRWQFAWYARIAVSISVVWSDFHFCIIFFPHRAATFADHWRRRICVRERVCFEFVNRTRTYSTFWIFHPSSVVIRRTSLCKQRARCSCRAQNLLIQIRCSRRRPFSRCSQNVLFFCYFFSFCLCRCCVSSRQTEQNRKWRV